MWWCVGLCVFVALVLTDAKTPTCPDGYQIAGPYYDWCCKGVCPKHREWTNAEDICALTTRSWWPPLCPVTDVALGESFDVFTWGSNEQGQCGIPLDESHKALHRPTKVASLDGNNVLDLALGYQHTIAITYSYQVYVWGSNSMDQLGIGGQLNQTSPMLLNELSGMRVRAISAGGYHSCAVDKYGNMYTWGANNHGQLGRPESRPDYALPVPNFRHREIVAVSLGLLHSCAITRDMDIYCWGAGFGYQLGHGVPHDEPEPRVIRVLQGIPIVGVAAGCEHTLALASNGTVFVWGANKHGELGLGDNSPRAFPANLWILEKSDVTTVHAGCHHSGVVTDGGYLYLWGWNEFGQLAMGDVKDRNEPAFVARENFANDKVFHLALGYAHSVVMTKSQRVYTFGYGDMGQLGLADDRNRTVAFDVPEFSGNAIKVAAGGYHSAAISRELLYNPSYNAADDPRQNQLSMKLKFKEDLEAQALARLNGPYKETIRVHVRPDVQYNHSSEFSFPPEASPVTEDDLGAEENPIPEEQTNVQISTQRARAELNRAWKPDDNQLLQHDFTKNTPPGRYPKEFDEEVIDFGMQRAGEDDDQHAAPRSEGDHTTYGKPFSEEGVDSLHHQSEFQPAKFNEPYMRHMVDIQHHHHHHHRAAPPPRAGATAAVQHRIRQTNPNIPADSGEAGSSEPSVNTDQSQGESTPSDATKLAETPSNQVETTSQQEGGDPVPQVQTTADPTTHKYGVQIVAPSPSPSPRPLIPVDTRRYIPMKKHVLETNDQLPVNFHDDHRTTATINPYHHRKTAAQAKIFDTRHALVNATALQARKSQVNLHAEAYHKLPPPTPSLISDDLPMMTPQDTTEDGLPTVPEFPSADFY